jgi:hypothetical protein
MIAERSFDLRTSGLWAQHASAAPLCSTRYQTKGRVNDDGTFQSFRCTDEIFGNILDFDVFNASIAQ